MVISQLLALVPWQAHADCHEKCNSVCVQGEDILASCYASCRATCSDDEAQAERDAAHPPAHQYAAAALSPKTLIYGYSLGLRSRAEAEAAALDACAKAPGKPRDCKVQLSFHDKCGSLALKPDSGKEDGVWGVDWASDRIRAEQTALKNCTEIAGEECKTEVTFCARR